MVHNHHNSDEARQYSEDQPNPAAVEIEKTSFIKRILEAIPSDKESLRLRLQPHLKYFTEEYAKADVLARYYQKWYQRASVSIYLLSAIAVIVVSAQHLFHLHHLIVALELLAMIAILVILLFGNRIGWHRRWLDYRFLAERIRYGFYLAILVEKGDQNIAKSLSYRWAGETWCHEYFRQFWEKRPRLTPFSEEDTAAISALIANSWLEDQRQYHFHKETLMRKKHQRISRLSSIFFWLTLVAAFLHLLPAGLFATTVLTFLAIVFPTLAATFTGLRSHFDYNKTADRSRMMVKSLEHLQRELSQCSTLQQITEVVIEAESLMIQENSDWYINVGLHRLEPA